MLRRPPTRITTSAQEVDEIISQRQEQRAARAASTVGAGPQGAQHDPAQSQQGGGAAPQPGTFRPLIGETSHPADVRERERHQRSIAQRLGVESGMTSHASQ